MIPPAIAAALGKWALVALAGVGLFLAGYAHRGRLAAGETAKAQLAIALDYAAAIAERQAAADGLAEQNAALRAGQAAKDRIITEEIVRYELVTPPDLRCLLPHAWRLRHDAAATGLPAAAEAGPVDAGAAAPIDDAAALATVGGNYESCRDAAEKLKAWQRRYQALEAGREKSQ